MLRRCIPTAARQHQVIAPRPGLDTTSFAETANFYRFDVSASNRAKCPVCNYGIAPGELRVGSHVRGSGDFFIARYHHLGCAYGTATKVMPGLFADIDRSDGFLALTNEHKDKVVQLAARDWAREAGKAPITFADTLKATRGMKLKDIESAAARLNKANEALLGVKTKELRTLYLDNHPQSSDEAIQAKVAGMDRGRILSRLAEYLAFGVPAACGSCGGLLAPEQGPMSYRCTGMLDEYTACDTEWGNTVDRTAVTISNSVPSKAQLAKVSQKSERPDAAAAAGDGLRKLLGVDDLAARAREIDLDPKVALHGVGFAPRPGVVIPKKLVSAIESAGGAIVAEVVPPPDAEAETEGSKKSSKKKAKGNKSTKSKAAKGKAKKEEPASTESAPSPQVITIPVHSDTSDTVKCLSVTSKWIDKALELGRCPTFAEGSEFAVDPPPLTDFQQQQILERERKANLQQEAKDGGQSSAASSPVQFAGSTPIDSECSLADSGYKFVTAPEDGAELNCTFNKVDMQTGANTFYVIQAINMGGGKVMVFRRWGRLGDDMRSGKKEETFFYSWKGWQSFTKIFEERTGCPWDARASYKKQKGFYHWVNEPEYDAYGQVIHQKATKKADADADAPASTLPAPTQKLLDLLFDESVIEQSMQTMNIDTKKMPLSGLTLRSVEQGSSALKEIEKILSQLKKSKKKPDDRLTKQIVALTNRFYSSVPHVIPESREARAELVLDTTEKVGSKALLLDDLTNILITKELSGSSGVDTRYDKLNADLEWLPTSNEEAKMVIKFAENTQGSTHRQFRVLNVWKLARKGEEERFKPWADNSNRMLLWHGSRITNWVGILSQGLRIAPPEAPVSGYMFGKGIYFADVFSKSAGYMAGTHGLLCLAEVALGTPQERQYSHYVDELDKGYHSTYAIGGSYPSPKQNLTLPNGLVVPTGKLVDRSAPALRYNEFIVYDVSQACMRYLVEVDA